MSLDRVKHVPPGSGKQISPIGGDLTTYKAVSADTLGAYALLEQVIPAGHGPRRHIHRREDEAFYILEGQFEFHVGDSTLTATAGSYVFAPKDVPHAFKNSGTQTGKLLLFISPPGLETFFEEYSDLLKVDSKDLQTQADLAAKYGMEFV